MAFEQEAVEQLSRELLGGYNLNTRLLALLGKPLDSRGQEEAVAISQEPSGVFRNLMVSLFMLKSGDSGGVPELWTPSPETTVTEGSVDQRTPAKHKRVSPAGLTPHRKVRGELITEEATDSPFKDGYLWRKYGQKNIQNREFARLYYKCMYCHDRGCNAKKQVQQQDDSRGGSAMYQVTYVNEHTCHHVLPKQNISAPRTSTLTDKNISTTRSGHHPQHHVVDGNVELENNIMTWTLKTVISGDPSPSSWPSQPPVEASLSDPAMYYAPDGAGHAPSLLDVSMGLHGSRFPLVEELAASSLSSSLPPLPVKASSSYPAGGGNLPSMDTVTMEEMYFMCGPPFSPVAV